MEPTLGAERPNLLLAEDDRAFGDVLSRALESRGYAVHVAHNGALAKRLIDDTALEYAVIDLRLPDITGLKLIEYLRLVHPRTNILVLTGYGSIATAVEAIKLGATHYLTKPTSADQIAAAFERKAPDADVATTARPLSVDRLEWEHIQRVLCGFGENISATARALNMHRRTLQRKLNKHPPRE